MRSLAALTLNLALNLALNLTLNLMLAFTAVLFHAGHAFASDRTLVPSHQVQMMSQATVPANYYDQFMFRVVGDCSNINGLAFVSRGSLDPIPLGTDSIGRKLGAYFTLNLFEGGRYWARYVEFTEQNDSGYEITFTTPISGTWHVQDDKLELSGIGVATPVRASSGDAFEIMIARDFRAKISGRTTTMTGILTNEGPHGETPAEYCK